MFENRIISRIFLQYFNLGSKEALTLRNRLAKSKAENSSRNSDKSKTSRGRAQAKSTKSRKKNVTPLKSKSNRSKRTSELKFSFDTLLNLSN